MVGRLGRRMPNFNIFSKKDVVAGGLGAVAGAGAVGAVIAANDLNVYERIPESVSEPAVLVTMLASSSTTTSKPRLPPPYIYITLQTE